MSDHIVSSVMLASRECCPDFTIRVCGACQYHIAVRLDVLARNLAVAGGLCAAFWSGRSTPSIEGDISIGWRPGCGRRAAT